MKSLKNNVSVFDQDVRENQGYRYSQTTRYSSVVANRRMTEAVLKWLEPTRGTILDAGCGDGAYTNQLKSARSDLGVVGYDAAAEAVKLASQRYPDIEFFVANMLRVETFPKREFDAIVIRGILHHLADPALAIKLCRELSSRLIIVEPNGNNPILKVIERVSIYHREHEEQSFTSNLLQLWCAEAGYRVVATEFIGFVPFFFPSLFSRVIYFFQPLLEQIPLLGRYLGAQVVIVCEKVEI